MITSYDIIKSLIRTEKSTLLELQRKYLFLVNVSATKIQIRKAIEEIYKVKVSNINTLISRGKLKRVRYKIGKSPDSKKALATLREGNKIVAA